MASAGPRPQWVPVSGYFGPVLAQIEWPAGGAQPNLDLDISALVYRADGTMMDVCYFKNTNIMGGAIGHMGDAVNTWGYQGNKEGTFVSLHLLPEEAKFVFFLVNVRSGAANLASTGTSLRLADGGQQGGRYLRSLPLNAPTQAMLVACLIRPPPHLYPPEWSLQFDLGLNGPGADFNESLPLIETYLKACVAPELLDARPPHDATQFFDLSKNNSYFLDPAMPTIHMGLGWQTSCDLDAHAFLLDSWYQKIAHVYKNHLSHPGVTHSGNARSGWASEIDEVISVNLPALQSEIKHIVFFVRIVAGEEYRDSDGNVHRRPAPSSFSGVARCFATVMDPNFRRLADFQLSQDGLPGRTRLMCVVSRYGRDSRWQMLPLGTPTNRGVEDSSSARHVLVEATRPDLCRRVRITMGVIAGRNLVAKDKGGTSDPYVEIKFYDHKTKKKTDIIKKNLEPKWNKPELVTWEGRILDAMDRIECKIDVYDHDRFSFDDHMGRVMIHLRDVLNKRGAGPIEMWMPLGQKHPGENKHVTGEILVTFCCIPMA